MAADILYERYKRQIILKGFGEAGQRKLLQAKVLVVGAGGLGCPALQYLVAAGIGSIGIADDDVVSMSNLHRQVLYSVNDIGLSKALRAAAILKQLNPGIKIIAYNERLNTSNALTVIKAYDLIIDGSDNFATRYLINDACVLLKKPFIYGAVSQYEGQLALFNAKQYADKNPVNYRDMFPDPPKSGEVLNCEQGGVLGVLPGIIGTMMASEAIKYFTGIGTTLANRLINYNVLTNQFYEMELMARDDTHLFIPADETSFGQMDYDWLCSSPMDVFEISKQTFTGLLGRKDVDIIDVREPFEMPVITEFTHLAIPSADLISKIDQLRAKTIILFCQSGKRSLQAARQLSGVVGASKKVYSLYGGITLWKQT